VLDLLAGTTPQSRRAAEAAYENVLRLLRKPGITPAELTVQVERVQARLAAEEYPPGYEAGEGDDFEEDGDDAEEAAPPPSLPSGTAAPAALVTVNGSVNLLAIANHELLRPLLYAEGDVSLLLITSEKSGHSQGIHGTMDERAAMDTLTNHMTESPTQSRRRRYITVGTAVRASGRSKQAIHDALPRIAEYHPQAVITSEPDPEGRRSILIDVEWFWAWHHAKGRGPKKDGPSAPAPARD
jgi:hypothetical protein